MASKPGSERTIPRYVPMQPGYVFVPKGDVYITKHCSQITKAGGKDVYIVVDNKNRRLGIRCPVPVHHEVQKANEATKSTRLAAIAARDSKTLTEAQQTLLRLFPAMPASTVPQVIDHAYAKHSGRVGRTSQRTPEEKVTLSVRAHIRHHCTPYESLLREGVDREDARRQVLELVDAKMRAWQGLPEQSPRRMSFRTAVPLGGALAKAQQSGGVEMPVKGRMRASSRTPLQKKGGLAKGRSKTSPKVVKRKVVRKQQRKSGSKRV